MKKLISNYHTHTFRCGHALDNPDEDYVLKAISLGYKNLGFSDHAPFKGVHHPSMRMDFDKAFPDYISSINKLKEKYKDKINIFIGLEIEYIEDRDEYYKELLNDYHLDYLILGQHCIYDNDGNPHFYTQKIDDEEGFERYTRDLIKGISRGYFSYVCHPDLLLNGFQHISPKVENLMDEICDAANKYEVPLEININGETNNKFAAIKRCCFHYPSEIFFKKAVKHKNKLIFGVDAHAPWDFDRIDYNYFSKFLKDLNLSDNDILKELEFKKIK